MERYVKWNELTEAQKYQATWNYAEIRSVEEQEPCEWSRAVEMAPHCRGYWVDNDGYVCCNI